MRTKRTLHKRSLLTVILVVTAMTLQLAITATINQNQQSVSTATQSRQPETTVSRAMQSLSAECANSTGGMVESSPAVDDLDRDGKPEVAGSNDGSVYRLSISTLQTGTLTIFVFDSSSGEAITGACANSTYAPPGQRPLFNVTLGDGSVTFRDVLAGRYYFEVTKSGYVSITQSVQVLSNQTTLTMFSLTSRSAMIGGGSGDVSGGMSGTTIVGNTMPVAGIATFLFFLVILVLGMASRNVRGGREGPTFLYEDTPQSEERSDFLRVVGAPTPPRRFCPYCGVAYTRADSSYCWNCGANLAEQTETGILQARKRGSSAAIGRCMVCNLDVNQSESVVWCPYCGNMGHRTHMLEWLHIRSYCPECYHHLDKQDLRSQE